jgi:heme-degrading monooxygenase HmoA
MADRMVTLASRMPGFLGLESVRGANGFGITISYWESEEAIRDWNAHSEHQVVQETGKECGTQTTSSELPRLGELTGKLLIGLTSCWM